jgi:hypothetical protein
MQSPETMAMTTGAIGPAMTANPGARRWIAAVVVICSAGVLSIAAWLTPSPTGLATHEALNLPPCGWVAIADMPCPTCGMTTAFAHAADGDLLASFLTQPLGCLLAIATAIALLVSVHVFVTGSRLWHVFTRLWTRRSPWILAVVVIGSWMYKIASYKGWIG